MDGAEANRCGFCCEKLLKLRAASEFPEHDRPTDHPWKPFPGPDRGAAARTFHTQERNFSSLLIFRESEGFRGGAPRKV